MPPLISAILVCHQVIASVLVPQPDCLIAGPLPPLFYLKLPHIARVAVVVVAKGTHLLVVGEGGLEQMAVQPSACGLVL